MHGRRYDVARRTIVAYRRQAAVGLFHLPLEFLDLNQMLGIEGQRWVIAVRLVSAETAIFDVRASRFELRRIPELPEIPTVVT